MIVASPPSVGVSPDRYVIASKLSSQRQDAARANASRLISRLEPLPGSKQHHEYGPAVVGIPDERELWRMREEYGEDVIITPLIRYTTALSPRFPIHARRNAEIRRSDDGRNNRIVRFTIVNSDNNPIAGAKVIAFFSLRWKSGGTAVTDINGIAEIEVPIISERVDLVDVFEVVYIYPPHTLWSTYQVNVPAVDHKIALEPLPSVGGFEWWATMLGVDRLHESGFTGRGIDIAIVDTGVGPHPDLDRTVEDGENFTTDGSTSAYEDVDGHGTHVAGIIGAAGKLVGIAPEAKLYAARVFQDDVDGADNSDIAAAIETAVDDWNCRLINLSLGGPYDPLVEDRINYATQRGTLCIAASGNSGSYVEYPASLRNCLCVSALGRLDTYPKKSIHKENEPESMGLFGADRLYAPLFTCRGREVMTCAPGVAIISTVPPSHYSALDGTSMACPIVTGITALLMNKEPNLLSHSEESRVGHLRAKIREALTDIRLPREYQGRGIIGA